ncbi:hypothetical protein VCHA53O466_140013 [Vibrio chagasii]|nr:hypothetical protein VCHA53O466_140013 [Vibrio chagasii]
MSKLENLCFETQKDAIIARLILQRTASHLYSGALMTHGSLQGTIDPDFLSPKEASVCVKYAVEGDKINIEGFNAVELTHELNTLREKDALTAFTDYAISEYQDSETYPVEFEFTDKNEDVHIFGAGSCWLALALAGLLTEQRELPTREEFDTILESLDRS